MSAAPDKNPRWPYVLIVAVVLLVWGQSVSFQFVWDDKFFIEDLQSIRSLANVPRMFYALDAQSSYPAGFVLFRPLRTLHYAILFALGGGGTPKPWLFHLANLLWHSAAAIMLYRFLLLLGATAERREPPRTIRWVALVGALAFAVHPVVSEVVCWAKSLDDLMATTFVLASCCALLSWEPEGGARRYWWAVGLFALAIYSKESAVPLALFCLPLLILKRVKLSTALRYTTPFLAVALIFIVHRHLVIGRTSQTSPLSGSYFQTLADTLPAGAIYTRLLTGIPPFCIDYSYMNSGHALTSVPVMLGAALLVILGVVSLLSLWRRTAAVGIGFLWIMFFFLPVSNLIPSMQYCAERFVYLPLAGWIIALGSLALLVKRWRLTAVVSVMVLLFWSTMAWNRSWIWKDGLTLFVQSHLQGPTTSRIQDNAVAAAFELPHMRLAFHRVQLPGQPARLVTVDPGSGPGPNWSTVEQTLLQLRNLFPNDNAVVNALAISQVQQGKVKDAISSFELAVQRQSQNPFLWINLGQARVAGGFLVKAEEAFQRAVALDANSVMALEQLARIQWELKKYAAAKKTYETLSGVGPDKSQYQERIAAADVKLTGALPGGNGTQ